MIAISHDNRTVQVETTSPATALVRSVILLRFQDHLAQQDTAPSVPAPVKRCPPTCSCRR